MMILGSHTGSSTSRVRYWSKIGLGMLYLGGRDLKISLAERGFVQVAVGEVVTSLILNMVLTISLLVCAVRRKCDNIITKVVIITKQDSK